MKILVSGIKPTGELHLGNYLGAIKNWVSLQNSGQYKCFFFIADFHALTIDIKPEDLRRQSFNLAVDLLSLGIDPKESIFFRQSDVIGHTELGWIFDCLIPVAELERMTQFKDMSQRSTNNTNAGLLTYPPLQAADVLLYNGEFVPIGEDQVQHLELSRIIARKFNNRYQKHFPEMKPVLSPTPRVMSLNQSDKKMSKSLGASSYIALRDDEQTITAKIKKAVTDEQGVKNLLELYSYFGDPDQHQAMIELFQQGKLMNVDLKKKLTEVITEFLRPIRTRRHEFEKNPKKINKILADGAAAAQKIADKNLGQIKKIIGLN